ncbi:MAG: hypothetical protein BWY29_00850 [Microgenomates group bacterium ADurb.Bin238]|nr:MAG: hypothetical protein BWY29_00850 [Microgenomates group bacterium ADurb.Bin238]
MPRQRIQFNLPVSILKEGKAFVAYSPAIDISTVGETFEEAQQRFEEAANIFFEETIEHQTFEEALLELGWRKENKRLVPPIVISNQTKLFSLSHDAPTPHA